MIMKHTTDTSAAYPVQKLPTGTSPFGRHCVMVLLFIMTAVTAVTAGMRLLAPLPDEFIRIDEFLVSVGLPPGNEKVRLFLDKKELVKPQRTASTVTFIPDADFYRNPQVAGPHRLFVRRYAGYGELVEEIAIIIYLVTDDTLSDQVRNELIEKGKELVRQHPLKTVSAFHNGRMVTWFENENYADTTLTIAEADIWGNGGYGDLKYDYNVTLRTDEQSHYQSLQRFRGGLSYRSIARLSAGDNWPAYHQSILRQQRVRGLELNLRTPGNHVGLDAVWGQLLRPVDPFVVNQSAVATAQTHNDTVAGYAPGTFGRDLKAMRLSFNAPYLFNASITVCKSTDDTSSIRQLMLVDTIMNDSTITGSTPMDNLVYGADAHLTLFRGITECYGSFAMSWLTTDISNGSLSNEDLKKYFNPDAAIIKPRNLTRILIINETTVPLPLPADSTESVNMHSLAGAMNWDAGMRFTMPIAGTRSKADVQYYYTGPTYMSFGNPYETVDRAGWIVNAETWLFDGRFFVREKFNIYNKDLLEMSATPTRVVHSTVSGQVALRQELPTLTMLYSVNDERARTDNASDPDLENSYYTVGGALSYAPRIGILTPNLSLSYYNSSTEITAHSLSNPFSMQSHTFVTSVSAPIEDIRFEPCASFSLNMTTDDVPFTLKTVTAGTRWHIIPEAFVTDFLLGYTGTDDPQTGDRNDLSLKTGGRYELSKRNTIWFDAGLKWSVEDKKADSRFKFNYELRY